MSAPRAVAPMDGPLDADVTLPGSKSITNRALICAALGVGTSVLRGALDADDTAAMIGALRTLGAVIDEGDVDTLTVRGLGGTIDVADVRLDARLSGTTSRFLLPLACLARGAVTIDGAPPLRARPMTDGIEALNSLGVRVQSTSGALPVTVWPAESTSRRPVLTVGGSASSQFLSGLLLAAPCFEHGLDVRVPGSLRSRPYVEMTSAVMRRFGADVMVQRDGTYRVDPTGYRSAQITIEPDASAASYFLAAAAIVGGSVRIRGLGRASLQGDIAFADVLEAMGVVVRWERDGVVAFRDPATPLRGVTVDMADISDTAQTMAVVAAFAEGPTTIEGIGFIRRKETDRIAATVSELRRCGVSAEELPDGIRIAPLTGSAPGPASIRTYDDHRMAMSFALIGLRVPGIEIRDPECVDKTFPHYWDVLESLSVRRP